MDFDIGRDLGLSLYKNIDREYTQNFVPIDDIKDGVVIVDNGGKKKYIKILEIIPVNFPLLSEDEQDAIIIAYQAFLRSAPSKFHIKVVTKRTDISDYLKAAETSKKNETNKSCRILIDNYMNYIYEQSIFSSIERHYYFIFEHEHVYNVLEQETEEDIIASLNDKAEAMKADFHSMGTTVIDWHNDLKGLASVYYDFYNPRYSRKEPFPVRLERIKNDTLKTHNVSEQDVTVNVKDLFAAKSMDFMKPDYMVVDGVYLTHYFVRSSGYPEYMSTVGWLSVIIGYDYGFDTDLYFIKGNSAEKIRQIQTHAKLSTIRVANKEADEMDYNNIMSNYQGTMYMMDALQNGGEDIYDICVFVTVYADTLKELYDKKKELEDIATKLQIGITECKRKQEEAFFTTAPLMELDPGLYGLSKHNITTNTVAATFPYTTFSLNDKEGISVGINQRNGTMILYDPFNADKYANANITIFGETGHGKTYTLLTMLLRLRCLGIQVFALAPDKQDEFRRACDAVGGLFVDISPASEQRINIFDIRPMTSPENEILGGTSYKEKSWLVDKVDNLKIWLSYLIPGITVSQKAVLETVLVKMYKDFGITQNNDSIYKDAGKKELKEMPIMGDFYDRVCEEVEQGNLPQDIKLILSQFITGAASNMNGHTNVDLDNKFIILGLENLKGDLMAPTMFSVLELVWAKCRENKTKKKVIAIDEGWQLLSGANEQVGEFVQEIFKVIRGFGGGAIFSTQSMQDLFATDNNYGNAIITCSHTNIILGMTRRDIKNICDELGLSEPEIDSIARAQIGEALFCAGENHVPIRVTASSLEHDLITTKRKDLEALAERNAK